MSRVEAEQQPQTFVALTRCSRMGDDVWFGAVWLRPSFSEERRGASAADGWCRHLSVLLIVIRLCLLEESLIGWLYY